MKQPTIKLLCIALTLTALATAKAETNRVAPDCALTAFGEGQRFDLQQYKGKVVYVDFWASWCGPCAKSFPFMNDLYRDLKDRGLEVLGINLDENSEDAKKFLERYTPNFTVAFDTDQQCAKDFEVKAMPSSYLVDRNGIIRHLHLGFRPGEAEQFRVLVEQLLAESPVAH
jgi:thiol-disulfide isomerase/thioredoxin